MTLAWASVPAAIGAAACFGAAGVLQHQATQKVPVSDPLRPRLLFDLIRLQMFRSGVVLGALGFILQIVALRYGPLILVQPLLVTGVLFYLTFAAALGHHKPDTRLVAGALMALAGLSGFLLAARPSTGSANFQTGSALPLGIALVALVAVCLLISQRVPDEIRQLPLAAATAVCYGVTAGLVRSVTSMWPSQGWGIFAHWELYAVIVVGPAGFLLNQNAYQSGLLGSVALATITVGDPIVAIGIGMAWLGESIAGAGWATAAEVVSLALMAGGVLLLTNRAQQIADRMRASGYEAGRKADPA
ncbi:MAG: DMT family transporter [Nocardioidaceae bacterium]